MSNAKKKPTYASTWDDLAVALDVTRRAIQDWRADPRYHDWPRDRPDGRKNIPAWIQFMQRHNLKRAQSQLDTDLDDTDDADADSHIRPPAIAGSQAQWQKAILHEKHATEQLKRRTREGELLVATDLEIPLGATLATIQTKLSQFPARVARYLVGLRDPGEIEDRLRDEIDADLSELHSAQYVGTTLDTLLADLSFDEEAARLVKLVTFTGQDETALRELIARVALEILRRLGARALVSRDAAPASTPAPAQVAEAPPPVPPVETAPPRSPEKRPLKKSRKKPRRQPAAAPGEVEAAIAPAPKPKPRRRE